MRKFQTFISINNERFITFIEKSSFSVFSQRNNNFQLYHINVEGSIRKCILRFSNIWILPTTFFYWILGLLYNLHSHEIEKWIFSFKNLQLIYVIRMYTSTKFHQNRIMFERAKNKQPKNLFFAFFSISLRVCWKKVWIKVVDLLILYFEMFSIRAVVPLKIVNTSSNSFIYWPHHSDMSEKIIALVKYCKL